LVESGHKYDTVTFEDMTDMLSRNVGDKPTKAAQLPRTPKILNAPQRKPKISLKNKIFYAQTYPFLTAGSS
jgi:hypothetical protein